MEVNELLICQCHSVEHNIIFNYDTEWKDVYLSIHLNCVSFFKRLKYAIKYIFGYKCQYGAYDEIILKPKDWNKIRKIADFLESTYTKELLEKNDVSRTIQNN